MLLGPGNPATNLESTTRALRGLRILPTALVVPATGSQPAVCLCGLSLKGNTRRVNYFQQAISQLTSPRTALLRCHRWATRTEFRAIKTEARKVIAGLGRDPSATASRLSTWQWFLTEWATVAAISSILAGFGAWH